MMDNNDSLKLLSLSATVTVKCYKQR